MSNQKKPAGDEPKQVKKRKAVEKKQLGPKQQRLVRALITADSEAEAGRIAGYGTPQSTHRALKSIRRNAAEILDEIGYGQKQALSDLREMANAMETRFYANKGVVLDTKIVEANDIRLRARVELNKIHGHYPGGIDGTDQAQHTANRNTVCVVVSDARAAASLARLFAARSPAGPVIDVDAPVDQDGR